MILSNNLKRQIDMPVWEWCKFAPAVSTSTSCSCTVKSNDMCAIQGRYIYYMISSVAFFWRYDTVMDSWQQLASPTTAVSTGASMKFTGSQGYVGRVISAGASTIVTGMPFGGTAVGYRIRIISGVGQGQERVIVSVSDPVVADFGTATAGGGLGTIASITDANKNWGVLNTSNVACHNGWVGYNLRTTISTGAFQSRKILYNSASGLYVADVNMAAYDPWSHVQWTAPAAGTQYQIESSTVTVDTAWTVQPDNTSRYVIESGGIYLLSSATATPFYTLQFYDVLADIWYVKPALTNMIGGAEGTDFSLELMPDEATIWFSDQATGGSTNALVDTGANWIVNQWANYYVFIYSGLGMGQWSKINSNTSNTLTLNSAFGTPTNATSYYEILGYDFGVLTSTTWNTVSDSTKSWTTNQYANFAIRIVYGKGMGQLRTIQSNTSNTLTIYSNWNIQPDTTSVYCIQGDSSVIYFMLGGYSEVFLHKAGDTDMLSHGRVLDSGIAQDMCCYLSNANHTIYESAPISIKTITRSGTLATATSTYTNSLQIGQWVSIRGDTAYPQYYNGLFQIVSYSISVNTTFTYNLALDPGGSATGVGSQTVTTLFDASKQYSQMASGAGAVTTIGVGVGPRFSTAVGTYLYVNNQFTTTVSVIDTATNTVFTTITVGSQPYSSTLVGIYLYVNNNGTNTISVIDTTTNTVFTTITVGTNPLFSTLVGTYLYVNNNGTNTISVIDTTAKTVFTTITVGSGPYSSTLVGTYLYVNNNNNTTVSVIDTVAKTLFTTITVGSYPRFSTLVGTYLYVNNYLSSSVSVINTATNTVFTTITVGTNPLFSTLVGIYLYVNNNGTNTISVIDTIAKTVVTTVTVGSAPNSLTLVGAYMYVLNYASGTVSVINTATTNTITFSTPTPSNLNGWWVTVAYGARVLSGAGTTTLTLSDNIVGPFGLVTFNAWQPSFVLAYNSGGAQYANTVTVSSITPSTTNGMYVSGTGIATNTYVVSGASTATIILSNPNTGQISGNVTFGNPFYGNMLYATTAVPTQLTGKNSATAMQIASNTGNSLTVVASMGSPSAGVTRYVISKRDAIGGTWGGGASHPYYNSGISTAGSLNSITDTTARWTSAGLNITYGAQYFNILTFDNPTPSYITGWYVSGTGVQAGTKVTGGAGTNSITLSAILTAAASGVITFDAFYPNELVNKNIKMLSNTSGTATNLPVESLITAYDQSSQNMTITGTLDANSSYAIISIPDRAPSTGLIWPFNTTDWTTRGRYLYSPRGGVLGIDRLDITTDSWTPLQYSPMVEPLTMGSMYAYDGQNRLYFTVGVTLRVYYLDLITNLVYSAGIYPYSSGTAIIGNRMEIFVTEDGLKYLWLGRHSNQESFKVLLSY